MNLSPPPSSWTPLQLLRERFLANLKGLATRRPGLAEALRVLIPSQTYCILPQAEQIQLGIATPAGVQPLPHPLPPAAARQIALKLCPSGNCTLPVLVTGEDLGWLWNSLYQLPCHAPVAPGHRPPLFFLIRDMERLWVMLHLQEWPKLLADERVRLFIGSDAFDQFRSSLTQDVACPWPKSSVVVDQNLWPVGATIDGILQEAGGTLTRRFAALETQLAVQHAGQTAAALADLYGQSGRPLNILGITSRYTTFLQYSMRDWLAAFERLGHRTRLVIESADHEMTGAVAFAEASAEFKPDLIVCIDHFRKELGGVPANVPVAMWVQDALPNMFCPAAGAAQGPRDYSLGFGRLRMVSEFGYPAERYMSAVVGLDESRFAPRELSAAERERFGGEVAFVSHASATAEDIVAEEIRRLGTPEAAKLLGGIFEQMRAIYAAGGAVTEPIAIRKIIEQTATDTQIDIPPSQMQPLLDLFLLRVNNALFRHESLLWVAEMGVDLRIWGRGWESHPQLKRFARGIAENAAQLPTIYQANRINLQVTPHGAVHQRLVEGLAAGGFFLIRQVPGDFVEPEFREIGQWCRQNGITTDEALRQAAPPQIRARIDRLAELQQQDPFAAGKFLEQIQASREDGYVRSAAAVWADDYNAVSFGTKDELQAKVKHYLANDSARRATAESMRQVVLDRFTYTATSRRLLRFIADDLVKQAGIKAAA